MRRFGLALVALFALVAASPPSDQPAVIVYPLMAPATIDKETNGQITTLLGDQIAQGGVIRVLPADASITRADFLAAARKAGAQFYVTGFLTPLGDGASIVEQVVSTQSGVIVYSNSGQIATVADARGQGDILRTAILANSARSYAGFSEPSGATPVPARNASNTPPPQANVGGLFRRKRPAAAAVASPSPSPSPAP